MNKKDNILDFDPAQYERKFRDLRVKEYRRRVFEQEAGLINCDEETIKNRENDAKTIIKSLSPGRVRERFSSIFDILIALEWCYESDNNIEKAKAVHSELNKFLEFYSNIDWNKLLERNKEDDS